MVFLEKEVIVAGELVETRFTGHNSRISISGFKNAPETNICRLEHETELIYAPIGTFRKNNENKYDLLLNFSEMMCSPDQWEAVKHNTDEMMALWHEFLESQES